MPRSSLEKLFNEVISENEVGLMRIEIQFGLILVKHVNDKTYLDGVRDAAKMESKLNQARSNLQTDLLPRLTTSELDAAHLLGLTGSHDISVQIEYDIYIKTTRGETRVVRFEETDPMNFTVLRTDNIRAKMFMHNPIHVWDAQAVITKLEPDDEMRGAVAEFVKSIQSKDEAPSFDANVPANTFSVQSVHVKRIFTQQTGDVEARLAEVQDLWTSSANSNSYNFEAIATPEHLMTENQRLWWEYSLQADSVEMGTATRLQSMAGDIVSRIDGVGYENTGPFVAAEIEEPVQSFVGDGMW